MANTITGTIFKIEPVREFSSRDGMRKFQRRTMVLDATMHDPVTGARMYDNFPTFEFGGDKCALLDAHKVGEVVEVSFGLQGSKYNDKNTGEEKFFTRVSGYAIQTVGNAVAEAPTQAQTPPPSTPPARKSDDDLPF